MPVTTTSTQQFCSQTRHGEAIRRGDSKPSYPRVERVAVTCEQCGKDFPLRACKVVNVSNGSPRRYCSRACKGLAKKPWPIERTKLIEYACAGCGATWRGKSSPSVRNRKKYCSRACVGAAVTQRLRTESPTSIEAATYAALADMGIDFLPQHRIGRWVVDAFVPSLRLVVECQGDFHHCNPARYPDGPRGVIQVKTVERDARRLADLTAQGYRVANLWETDIRAEGARALLEAALSPA